LSRPFSRSSSGPQVRINGKIRAREVRVVDPDGRQMGVLSLHEAIRAAQARGVDLVEVAPNAHPPVCRLVDYGKYCYEKAKEGKEARKHQHANKVKEVQLSPSIDPHDFGIKLKHAIDFLCEEIKVKVTLKFRGREMAHKEIGFQVIERFIKEVEPFGHPDAAPKLAGRAVVLMISPLPRNKRAKNPEPSEGAGEPQKHELLKSGPLVTIKPLPEEEERPAAALKPQANGFVNNPFASLDLNTGQGA
jgi:translation initiation factor IF-3